MAGSAVEEKLAAARALGRALVLDAGDDIDSVYVGGSLTAGLGNATSDADLFVLTAADGDTDVTQYVVEGHRIDVERYPTAQAEKMVADVVDFELRRENLAELHHLPGALDFVFRLASSETVVGSERLAALRERIDAARPAIRRTAVNYTVLTLSAHLEDFVGAAGEGDLDTAALVGQSLVALAGKAVVAAGGDLYLSNKWVYKQLARTAGDAFPLQLFQHYQRGGWTTDGPGAAEELIGFAQTCVVEAQVFGGVGVPVAAWPARPSNGDGERLWRDNGFIMLNTAQGFLLHWELGRQVLLKQLPAVLWALCDGRTENEIVSAVGHLGQTSSALGDIAESRIISVLGSLRAKGLIAGTPSLRLPALGAA